MGDRRGDHKPEVVLAGMAAVALAGLALIHVDDQADRNHRKYRRSSSTIRDTSDERYENLPATPGSRRRASSWNPSMRVRNDDRSESGSGPTSHSPRQSLHLQIQSNLEQLPRRRSPGTQSYEQTIPRSEIYHQNSTIGRQDLRYSPAPISAKDFSYAGDQLRGFEESGGTTLFDQEGVIPWDDSSRPTTPRDDNSRPTISLRSYFEHGTGYPDYEYTKLPSSGERIRLMQLHPSQDANGPLRCSFYEVELHRLRSGLGGYEAVSYSWGTDRATDCLLYCDNCPSFTRQPERLNVGILRITKSAALVLQRFRLVSTEVILWIDAICLNQKDQDEKHYQLRHMADIYMKATRVLVWLDDRTMKDFDHDVERDMDREIYTGGEKCIQFFREFGQWARHTERTLTAADWMRGQYLFETFEENSVGKLVTFFQCIRWFSRRWIIQEITYAREAIVYCGRESVDWEDFVASINWLWTINASRRYFSRNSSLEAMRVVNTIYRMKSERKELSILEALNFFYASGCEQPQDRIIALLPISNDKNDYIDFHRGLRYINDKDRTYHRFSYFNLKKTNSLDILHCAGAFRRRAISKPCGLSWVPDWTCEPRFFSFLNIQKFNAGGRIVSLDIQPDESFGESDSYPDYSYLVVRGFVTDTIENLQSREVSSRPSTQEVKRFLNEWADIAECGPLHPRISAPDYKWNALATTLVADQALSETVSARFQLLMPNETSGENETRQEEINEWAGFRSLIDSSDATQNSEQQRRNRDNNWQYISLVKYTIKGRRLFKTRSGRLGIGPEDIKVGDCVTVLYGGRTPFVLRPVRNSGPNSDRFFCELIGDCYVHGIMNGSLLREPQIQRDFWIT